MPAPDELSSLAAGLEEIQSHAERLRKEELGPVAILVPLLRRLADGLRNGDEEAAREARNEIVKELDRRKENKSVARAFRGLVKLASAAKGPKLQRNESVPNSYFENRQSAIAKTPEEEAAELAEQTALMLEEKGDDKHQGRNTHRAK